MTADFNYHARPETWDSDVTVEALFTLEEPWRERFLCFTAWIATGKQWGDSMPDRDEVAVWLRNDWALQGFVSRMLRAWIRPKRPRTI